MGEKHFRCLFIFIHAHLFYCSVFAFRPTDHFHLFFSRFRFAWHCHSCNIYGQDGFGVYNTHTHICTHTHAHARTQAQCVCLDGIEFTFLVSRDSIKSKRNDVLATNRSIAELILFHLVECMHLYIQTGMEYDIGTERWND